MFWQCIGVSIGTYCKRLFYISPQTRMRLQAVLTAKSHDKQGRPRLKERPDLYQCNAQTEVYNLRLHIPREKDRYAFVVTAISRLLAVDSNDKDQFVAQSNEHIPTSPRSDRGQTPSFNSNRYH